MSGQLQGAFDKTLLRLAADNCGRFLLGVSGGVDSMCMATLFKESRLKPEFAIAHVNFALRGDDSDGDEAFVRDWAAANNVQFFTKRFETAAYAAQKGISIEMAARELRYGWFAELLEEHGFDLLAIAHNLNDAAETMYLNLLRGTGIRGLAGMRECSGKIIRPLLSFPRKELEAYARENGILHREDATNADSRFSRNRIRNEVFPQLELINPAFLETTAREMEHFREIENILDDVLEEKRRQLTVCDADAFCIDIARLAEEKQPGYWLFRLLQPFGFGEDSISRMEISLDGQSGKTFYGTSHKAIRDRQYLKIYPLDGTGIPQVDVSVFEIPEGFNPFSSDNSVLYIDADKVSLPLTCRRWQAADRFRPLGMKGFRKLSDFFGDLKLDLEQKRRQTVVTTTDSRGNEQIVCIAGLRIDDRFKITPETKRVAAISFRVQK